MSIDNQALKKAAKKFAALRLTTTSERKENPDLTLKAALKKGLGGLFWWIYRSGCGGQTPFSFEKIGFVVEKFSVE